MDQESDAKCTDTSRCQCQALSQEILPVRWTVVQRKGTGPALSARHVVRPPVADNICMHNGIEDASDCPKAYTGEDLAWDTFYGMQTKQWNKYGKLE